MLCHQNKGKPVSSLKAFLWRNIDFYYFNISRRLFRCKKKWLTFVNFFFSLATEFLVSRRSTGRFAHPLRVPPTTLNPRSRKLSQSTPHGRVSKLLFKLTRKCVKFREVSLFRRRRLSSGKDSIFSTLISIFTSITSFLLLYRIQLFLRFKWFSNIQYYITNIILL